MVPPFLAYYGMITRSPDLIAESYNQCRLYRDGLMEFGDKQYGLWKHIQQGRSGLDPGYWSTGMLIVYPI